MSDQTAARNSRRRILFVVLGAAVGVLLLTVAVIVAPILTHQSAGGSGQSLPTEFVSQVSAKGADGRFRTLSVQNLDRTPADLSQLRTGDELVVRGAGYDANIGIYVSICLVPDTLGAKPSPCLGGLPDGAMQGEAAGSEVAMSSAWITDDWAWRTFANKGYDDPTGGAFEIRLLVPPAAQDGLDCTLQKCAIATRADHTAATDRVQDLLLPVAFVE